MVDRETRERGAVVRQTSRVALLLALVLAAMGMRLVMASQSPAPAVLRLPDIQGQQRDLKEWAGRPVLLNYWATWCGPCLKEMPELEQFARSQPPSGVQVVGIALDERDSVRAYLERVPVRYPILLEAVDGGQQGGTSSRFGNAHGVLPYSVLLDAGGRVVRTKAGSLTAAELENWAASLRP